MNAMEWGEALTIPAYSELRALGLNGVRLDDRIYRVRENMYFQLVRYDRQLEGKDRGPHVTRLVWGESDGAAQRVICGQLEKDRIDSTQPPPKEMLLEGLGTYADIYNLLRQDNPNAIIESAIYNSEGEFVHVKLSERKRDGFEFFFRSNNPQPHHTPYAIAKALSEGRDPITL